MLREACLPTAPRSNQGNEANVVLQEEFAQAFHLLLAPDKAGERGGQIMQWLSRVKLVKGRLFPLIVAKNIRLQLRQFKYMERLCPCVDGLPTSQDKDNSRYFIIKQASIE